MNTEPRPRHSDAATEAHLADVVDEITQRLNSGKAVTLEEYTDLYPEIAEPLARLWEALTLVRQPEVSAGEIEPFENLRQHRQLGDFRIVREIGRGGMGVVYEAEQLSLDRTVALKVLPFAAMLDQKQLQRFKNEVRAAAGLHHTNIVPVYSVGCERGVHFYAMQYVQGQTLADVIGDLRKRSGKDRDDEPSSSDPVPFLMRKKAPDSSGTRKHALEDSAEQDTPSKREMLPEQRDTLAVAALSTARSTQRPTYFRSVAKLGIQAAEALEHAHQQGVVHRDIKPSNLILDPDNKLWVTDFGLAQVETDGTLTLSGDLLGTLRYMSPEQALGNRTVLDHRTDLYSLGTTLYELLTLQPVFTGADRQELLRQISQDEPRAPGRINRAIPADLGTIVLKAMHKDAEERFASAQELADDLKRFLNDQPIRAKRPSIAQRSMKWSRRHKAVLVAIVIVLFVTLSIGAVLLWQERNRTLAALADAQQNYEAVVAQREEAEQQRQIAEASFSTARKAVDQMLTRVGEQLTDVPHTLPLRRSIFEDALAFYLQFLQERPDDPTVRYETARALLRIGEISRHAMSPQHRQKVCIDAVALLEQLTKEYPDRPDYHSTLVLGKKDLGAVLYQRGEQETAEEELREALELVQSLARSYPDTPLYRQALATTHVQLGTKLCGKGALSGQYQEALRELRRGLDLHRQLVAEVESPRHRDALADTLHSLGDRLGRIGRLQEAEHHLREAASIQNILAEEAPSITSHQIDLATLWFELGQTLLAAGRPHEAIEEFEKSIAARERLLKRFSSLDRQQLQLHIAHEFLGEALAQAGQMKDAEAALRHCLDLRREFYGVTDSHSLAWTHHELALVLQAADRSSEAEAEFRRANDIRAALIAKQPAKVGYRRYLAWGLYEAGILFDEIGRAKEAKQMFQRARAEFQTVMNYSGVRFTEKLWWNWFLADCPHAEFRDSQQAAEQALQWSEEMPPAPEVLDLLGIACYRSGRWEEAIDALERSSRFRSGSETPQPHRTWPFLAMAHWRLGDHKEALRVYEQMRDWMETNGLNPRYHELRRWVPEATNLIDVAEDTRSQSKQDEQLTD